MSDDLLPAATLARLERLQLGNRRRLAGRFSGEHRSPRHGSSLDFADYREYHPGDDFRRIDYALYARTDQLFIRLFEAEDDLALRLLVDTSGSMGFHGKMRQAARLAASLGFVALTRRDIVTLMTFPNSTPPRRFNGRGAVSPMLRILGELQAGGETDVRAAATDALASPGVPGMTVIVSDLLSPSWESAIDRLPSRGGDSAVVHVLAREEIDPELMGDLDVEDAESGDRVAVSLATDSLKKYAAATQTWLDRVAARCRSRGVAYTRVLADADLETVLFTGWREEGLVR